MLFFFQEVKKFLTDDFEVLFENTKFKKVPGKSPELKFFNQHGEELEKMDISRLTRSGLATNSIFSVSFF